MGLEHGCLTTADDAFSIKHKISINRHTINKCIVSMSVNSHIVTLVPVYGDCTACSIYFREFVPISHVRKVFPLVLEYMSMNARISCFFSIQVDIDDLEEYINIFQKEFPIVGLHVHKSNRQDGLKEQRRYQITGILKCAKPYINNYTQLEVLQPESYNHLDATEYNEMNAALGLPTL